MYIMYAKFVKFTTGYVLFILYYMRYNISENIFACLFSQVNIYFRKRDLILTIL